MVNETLILGLSCIAGVVLGAFFYGGLALTVRIGVQSEKPVLIFLLSLLMRIAVLFVGIYFVSGGRLERLLLCLLGIIIARIIINQITGNTKKQKNLTQGVKSASEPG